MFFSKLKAPKSGLRPFTLRIRDGVLAGLANDPLVGSPCVGCIKLWLDERRVWFEMMELSEMRIRRDVLVNLIHEDKGHTFFEVHNDGTMIRLDCLVYPHPNCSCNRGNFCAPLGLTAKTNFAFSPLYQIKCARYGTPKGNLWLTSATGNSLVNQKTVTVYAAGSDRENSRLGAVDEWLKKTGVELLKHRSLLGEPIGGTSFQDGAQSFLKKKELNFDAVGAGESHESALLNGLERLGLVRTLKQYSAKNPMLIVGANSWVREKVPFFLLQQYDFHFLFYPNSTPCWVTGIVALSRIRLEEAPLFAFSSGRDINQTIDDCIGKILVHCRPSEWSEANKIPEAISDSPFASKLHLWWTNWVYRCPKISLRDVLQLESYSHDLELWRNFYRDGQDPLSWISANSPNVPIGIRTLVALQLNRRALDVRSNVNGIGVWSNVSELFHP